MPIQKLRNLVVEDTKNKFKTIGVPNLNTINIDDLVWDQLSKNLQTLKPWTCVKNCNG